VFGSVLCCFNKFIDRGARRGNLARARTQWRHKVALHEAMNALHWAMRITLYRPGGMAIKVAVDLPAFLSR